MHGPALVMGGKETGRQRVWILEGQRQGPDITWDGVLENWKGQRALDSGETVLSQGTEKRQTMLETEVETGQAPLDR